MKIFDYNDIHSCADDLCEQVVINLTADIKQNDRATLILSGGSTPKHYLEKLASYAIPWHKVTVSLADERCVEDTHLDSNELLVKNHFLEKGAGGAKFLPLYEGLSPLKTISHLNQSLDYNQLSYSSIILGMGDDGHFASIFPHSPGLDEALFDPVNLYSHQTALHTACADRITMNLCAFNEAKKIFVVLTGENKREIFYKAQEKIDKLYPISFLLNSYAEKLSVFMAC